MSNGLEQRVGGDALHLLMAFLALAMSAPTSSAAETVVPVVKEPHHHVVRENAYVRVIDASLAGGDSTQYHLHATPSVIVTITNAPIETQVLGQPLSAPVPSVPGTVKYAPYGSKPLTHRVVNPGTKLFRTYDIELLRPIEAAAKIQPVTPGGMEPILSESLVRAYRLRLIRHQKGDVPSNGCAHMLIDISGTVVLMSDHRPRSLKAGDYIFAEPGAELQPEALGAAECVVLELP